MKKRNKALIIMSAIMAGIALSCLLIGGWLEGWNFSEWFTSTPAYVVYIFAIIYIGALLYIIIGDKIKRM